MFLPSSVAEKLRCHQCHLILNATPVKVYKSKRVKCARCTLKNDCGTISWLYSTVLNYLRFHCVNQVNGCGEVLAHFQVIEHEAICPYRGYSCPICDDTNKYNFPSLSRHIRQSHKTIYLKWPDFMFSIDEEDVDLIFLYSKGTILSMVTCKYDITDETLYVIITAIGQTEGRRIRYRLYICNVNNQVVCSTNPIQCIDASKPPKIEEMTGTKINKKKFPRGMVCLKFDIYENPVLHLPDSADYVNHEQGSASITWVAKDLTRLFERNELTSKQYFVLGVPWRLILKKKFYNNAPYLGIYLKCDKLFLSEEEDPIYYVLSDFTLFSCNASDVIHEPSSQRDVFKKGADVFGISQLVEWSAFVAPQNGYIHNNRVTFKMEIDVQVRERPKSIEIKCFCGANVVQVPNH